jgi:hypothetical protein
MRTTLYIAHTSCKETGKAQPPRVEGALNVGGCPFSLAHPEKRLSAPKGIAGPMIQELTTPGRGRFPRARAFQPPPARGGGTLARPLCIAFEVKVNEGNGKDGEKNSQA